MKDLLNYEAVRSLRPKDKLVQFISGDVRFFSFVCIHPENDEYVILLDHTKHPVRFHYTVMAGTFHIGYTSRDIITYRRDYLLKKLKECEQALSEFDVEGNLTGSNYEQGI